MLKSEPEMHPDAEQQGSIVKSQLVRSHEIAPFNPFIHGARGCFAVFVFLFHVINSGLPTATLFSMPGIHLITRSLEYGVELFFMVSGFVISESLTRKHSVRKFIQDRAIRIFPVLWVTIIATALVGFMFHRLGPELSSIRFFLYFPANLLALPGLFPIPIIHPAAWSLSYEIAFYIICAITFYIYKRRGVDAYLCLIVALSVGLMLAYPRAVYFALGFIVYMISRQNKITNYSFVITPGIWLILFLGSWASVQKLSPLHIQNYTLLDWSRDSRIIWAGCAYISAMTFFLGIVKGRGMMSSLLKLSFMQWLGTISYSFYLWHPLIMALIKAEMTSFGVFRLVGHGSQLLFLLITLPISLIVAGLSHHIFEVKARYYLKNLLPREKRIAKDVAMDSP